MYFKDLFFKKPKPEIYFLIGFMGCGKTTLSNFLSEKKIATVFDVDRCIERTSKKSIPEIFAANGETGFRLIEGKILSRLVKKIESVHNNSVVIISCGGGILNNTQTANFMSKKGKIIFIDVPFEVCYNRIKNDKNRPNAYGKTRDELKILYDARKLLYGIYADSIIKYQE